MRLATIYDSGSKYCEIISDYEHSNLAETEEELKELVSTLVSTAEKVLYEVVGDAPVYLGSAGTLYIPFDCNEDEEEAIERLDDIWGNDPWGYCFDEAYKRCFG